jgi:membrane protein YqaA with SNARE-associated domain
MELREVIGTSIASSIVGGVTGYFLGRKIEADRTREDVSEMIGNYEMVTALWTEMGTWMRDNMDKLTPDEFIEKMVEKSEFMMVVLEGRM